ncbi:MAG: beta-ketoacyl synthase N-terminal-like domain-containing protein [Desulfobacteraceae bacterium]|jgi:acyl transferase domain-containing protein/3-hydroxymyristoyl/3-hydroxydecanoyl-(acyl carrier protein) dehydratase
MGEFQIPPGEIPDILPQQLLMLKVASGAMNNAGLPLRHARERMGTIIGIGFDYEATNFHLRWALPKLANEWNRISGASIETHTLEQWLPSARDDCGPPLTATRTLGALGGIVASRIAREFRFGGPSFVVSAEEASGFAALDIARNMLRSGQVDAMLVGAVDLNGDERNMASLYTRPGISAKGEIRPFDAHADGTLPGEGAVALVLKRLEDARADGDRIYALLQSMGSASAPPNGRCLPDESVYTASLKRAFDDAEIAPDAIDLMESHGCGIPDYDGVEARSLRAFFGELARQRSEDGIAIGTLAPIAGHTGAVTGLAAVAKSALSLFHRIIPPASNYQHSAQTEWERGVFYFPVQPVYWSRNRQDGPRKACVASMTSLGGCMHAVLAEPEPADQASSPADQQCMRPMGALPCGLFVITGHHQSELMESLENLATLAKAAAGESTDTIEGLAHHWYHQSSNRHIGNGGHTLSIVAGSVVELESLLKDARSAVENGTRCTMGGRGGIAYFPDHSEFNGRLAFIYPGSGNHYIGMGRTLGAHWPGVLEEMDAATERFKFQLLPRWYDPWRVDWRDGWSQQAYKDLVSDPLHTIFGQVLFGGQVTQLLKKFKITPSAVIGYSLGESAGLFAMGVWPDRAQMLSRLEASDLFKNQLAGPCESVRKSWKIADDQPIEWRAAAVNRDVQTVDRIMADLPHLRRLIVNTPHQCVIGGLKTQVEAAIEKMQCTAVYLDGVVAVHCDAALPAAQAYYELHRFDTAPLEGVQFYSCAFEKVIPPTTETTAESITKQALEGFHFPRTIEQAYQDGVRIFLEIGPHCSCTRMIDDILDGKPHLAVTANHRSEYEPLTLLKCVGSLAAVGVAVDLDPLYGYQKEPSEPHKPKSRTTITVPVGGQPLSLKLPAVPSVVEKPHRRKTGDNQSPSIGAPIPTESFEASTLNGALVYKNVIDQLNENVTATARAHEKFLELSQALTSQYGKALEFQTQLAGALKNGRTHVETLDISEKTILPDPPYAPQTSVAFDRAQCMEFAIGSVGKMLGPQFDIVDTYKARVRLPDEPLMLVDRIISVEGEKRSLGSGRVVTEHDVLDGAWYLDGKRAPVCISVEAGQADLFLCAYLGIDHQVKGERTYRLLDARIRFHRGLPRPGETIRYDIHIDKFVRQEETYLFFFRFEGFIGDQHLITMTEGCAGFFTEEEVRNSGGIILTEDDKAWEPSINGTPYAPLIDLSSEAYDESQIDALRRGDAGACFGSRFKGIQLPEALCLPDGRMRLIHRVVSLEPEGGRFKKGYIRAEADIHPDDWFLTCHFVDDMVMPGTLMYECCAHTLRVLLLRLGWVTDQTEVCYEPIQGIDCRLKCRGPVTPATRHVHYAVEIKEIGYKPEPYVIADAHMYADGHYIVFFKDMSMQMTGETKQHIQTFWKRLERGPLEPVNMSDQPHPHPLFTHEHILEFAIGRPSKAFGRPYAVFDQNRTIARLPGPPYCFMDRITAIEPEAWVLKPDGWVEAQYDVPETAWYFAADRSGIMPFCVLLEIALQPCGWLAAYAGSALKSDSDLKFRNLGGSAVQHANLLPEKQTLTMRTRMTKVSEAADMIIENFDFQVLKDGRVIYTGATYFGFFTAQALSRQVGLRESVYQPSEREISRSISRTCGLDDPVHPDDASDEGGFTISGLNMPAKALCMIDGIDAYCPDGGPHGLGYVRGYKMVDPGEWFFKAHFYQDPVWPGSLGVESFLQLMKFAAMERWPECIHSHRFEMAVAEEHQWSYRGQVIPSNTRVMVEAGITRIEDGERPLIMADGCLQVDGIYIYKMQGFGLRLVPL